MLTGRGVIIENIENKENCRICNFLLRFVQDVSLRALRVQTVNEINTWAHRGSRAGTVVPGTRYRVKRNATIRVLLQCLGPALFWISLSVRETSGRYGLYSVTLYTYSHWLHTRAWQVCQVCACETPLFGRFSADSSDQVPNAMILKWSGGT